ncbi:hypothetical protein UlMin_041910 [Ulmus minor]
MGQELGLKLQTVKSFQTESPKSLVYQTVETELLFRLVWFEIVYFLVWFDLTSHHVGLNRTEQKNSFSYKFYIIYFWFCGHTRRDKDVDDETYKEKNSPRMFGSDEEVGSQVPTQVQTLVEGLRSVLVSEYKPMPNVDYLQPFSIGFFGTRNMGFIIGTNATFIRGALRAEKPMLLTVILPQRLKKQSPENQELLSKNVIEKPHNDHLTSSNCIVWKNCKLCKMDIISHVQQAIFFAFRGRMVMETCQEAKNL